MARQRGGGREGGNEEGGSFILVFVSGSAADVKVCESQSQSRREGDTDNIFLPSFKAEDDVESSSEAMATTMAPQRERASEGADRCDLERRISSAR